MCVGFSSVVTECTLLHISYTLHKDSVNSCLSIPIIHFLLQITFFSFFLHDLSVSIYIYYRISRVNESISWWTKVIFQANMPTESYFYFNFIKPGKAHKDTKYFSRETWPRTAFKVTWTHMTILKNPAYGKHLHSSLRTSATSDSISSSTSGTYGVLITHCKLIVLEDIFRVLLFLKIK